MLGKHLVTQTCLLPFVFFFVLMGEVFYVDRRGGCSRGLGGKDTYMLGDGYQVPMRFQSLRRVLHVVNIFIFNLLNININVSGSSGKPANYPRSTREGGKSSSSFEKSRRHDTTEG